VTEPAPTLEVVSTSVTPPVTHVIVKLRSSRWASIVGVAVRPGDDVRAVRMHGEALNPPGPVLHREAPWSHYECVTTPADGIDVELTLAAGQPIEVLVYDRKPGLPAGAPRRLGEARGPTAVPYGAGDYSVVARRETRREPSAASVASETGVAAPSSV
jgi:hypothetical protein